MIGEEATYATDLQESVMRSDIEVVLAGTRCQFQSAHLQWK